MLNVTGVQPMKVVLLAALSLLTIGVSYAADPAAPVTSPEQLAASNTTAFAAGREARASYEQWFASLPHGPYKDGATFWATNRSLKPTPSCATHDAPADWQAGCVSSNARLATVDFRRKAEKDYRWGWNSPRPQTIPSMAASATTTPVPTSVTSTPAATPRDDRFHAAVHREVACFTKAYRPSTDSSRDGGKSVLRLLGECGNEWDAASVVCQSDKQAVDAASCNFATSIVAQAFLFIQEGRPLPPELLAVSSSIPASVTSPPAPVANKAEVHGTPHDSNFARMAELGGGATVTDRQADSLAEIVRQSNYRCDSISAATHWVFSEGFTLHCNDLRYEYDISDKGGHWVVTVK
jgi:hypothetical protein